MPAHRLREGHTLLLEGPASIRLRDGSVQCLGAPVPVDEWVVVGKPRQAPLWASTSSLLEIRLGRSGSWREIEESTIPTSWSEASQILRQSPGVTVIVGGVDSGKSTLCTFLANECFKQGMKVAIVDADVGQADIGPPATISSSHLQKPIPGLQDLKPETMFFVGDTSPSSIPEKLIDFLGRLRKNAAESADIVLVNTDGWIGNGEALNYKLRLLTMADANVVLGLSLAHEIDNLLDLVTTTSLKLERSSYAKTRTKEERKQARETGYQRFLRDSKLLNVNLTEVKLRMFDRPTQAMFPGSGDYGGLLAGLLNRDEELLSIGRVRGVRGGLALIETQTTDPPNIVELGGIVLSSKYEEVGYSILH